MDSFEGDGNKLTSLQKQDIQPVSQRFKAFAEKVKSLWEVSQKTRTSLAKLSSELSEKKNTDEKLDLVRQKLEDSVPELKQLAGRIRSLHPKTLLTVYNSFTGAMNKKSSAGDVDASFAATDSKLELIENLVSQAKDLTTESLDQFETLIAEGLNWARAFEEKIGSIHVLIDENLNDLSTQLEDVYSKTMQRRCFWYGLIMCAVLNADTTTIYKSLRENPAITRGVIKQQDSFAAELDASESSQQLNELSVQANKVREVLLGKGDSSGEGVQLLFDKFQKDFNGFSNSLSSEADTLSELPGYKGTLKIESSKTQAPIAEAKQELSSDPGNAANLIDQGMGIIVHDSLTLDATKVKLRIDFLLGSNLPIGWDSGQFTGLLYVRSPADLWAVFVKFAGIFLTAFLISFGAPFWNDVLKSLLGIRGLIKAKTVS